MILLQRVKNENDASSHAAERRDHFKFRLTQPKPLGAELGGLKSYSRSKGSASATTTSTPLDKRLGF